MCDGHAKAAAFGFVHPSVPFPCERVKNMIQELRLHTDSRVGEGKYHLRFTAGFRGDLLYIYCDPSLAGSEFGGIGQDVNEDLPQTEGVTGKLFVHYVL